MSIISQETWDNMPEEEKERICEEYNESRLMTPNDKYQYERLFGKENLQPKPKIRTWEDVEKEHPEYSKDVDVMGQTIGFASPKIFPKLIATYKIAKLIELGYGGIVTKEECDNINLLYIIKCDYKGGVFIDIYKGVVIDKILTFRTKEFVEEFMSYPENVELVKQYYTI